MLFHAPHVFAQYITFSEMLPPPSHVIEDPVQILPMSRFLVCAGLFLAPLPFLKQ